MADQVFDCIVVGAGIEGSATAYQLAKEGKKTLLVEQFPLLHSRGSSHGGSRITRRAYAEPTYTKIMEDGFRLWEELEKESGEQLYRPTGLLVIGKTDEAAVGEFQRSLNVNRLPHRVMSGPEISKKHPELSFGPEWHGVFDPQAGILLANRCLRAFQTEFVKRGGVIRDNSLVEEVVPGPIVQVRTPKETFRAKAVVLCLGPWAPKFLSSLGLKLPLQPWSLKVCFWKKEDPRSFSVESGFPCLMIEGGKELVYGLPTDEYPGLYKFAFHGGPDADPDFRDQVDASWCVEPPRNFIKKYMKGLDPHPAVIESCMYTMTPDTHPILDRHPKFSNIVIGAGFSGHGFKLAPVVGKILAALATGRQPPYDVNLFKIDRFSKTPPKSRL